MEISPSPPRDPVAAVDAASIPSLPPSLPVAKPAVVPAIWPDLEPIVLDLFKAFNSLNIDNIRDSLMLFDKELYKFQRRSWYDWTIFGDKRATFAHCQAACYELQGRAHHIRVQMDSFQTNPSVDMERAKNFLLRLESLQKIINGVATFGCDKLCSNYVNQKKYKNAEALRSLLTDAFKHISKARKILERKLQPCIPNLQMDLELKRYLQQVEFLLRDRDNCLAHLRAVRWTRNDGVILPAALAVDSLRERAYLTDFPDASRKSVLKNAACQLKCPNLAKDIPTLSGTLWRPMRLLSDNDEVSVFSQPGVTGTCERDGHQSDNLCNLYYEVDGLGNLKISCGAINTSRKAAQLAYAMNAIVAQHRQSNGRWIVHQLNSFFKEENLIQGVHTNVALNEPYFRELLRDPTLSLLHINTCFNATTMLKTEDPQSVTKINIDALGRLASFIMTDLAILLPPQSMATLTQMNLVSKLEGANRLAEGLLTYKKELQKLDGKNQFDQLTQSMKMARESKERAKKQAAEQGEAKPLAPDSGSESAAPPPSLQPSDIRPAAPGMIELKEEEDHKEGPVVPQTSVPSLEVRTDALPSLPSSDAPAADSADDDVVLTGGGFDPETLKNIRPMKTQLANDQGTLKQHLTDLAKNLETCIQTLEQQRPTANSSSHDKALLILNVYHRLLKLQLKLEKTTLTRSTEIELFLLLYTLLEIKPIIVCYSGLDRSGQVRAMSDAMAQMMEDFYQELIEKIDDKSAENQAACRIEARKKMFHLIVNMDANRQELLVLGNQSEHVPGFITKLSEWKEGAVGPEARAALFKAIDDKYPPASGTKGEDLKLTQFYIERILAQLLKTESEKTFNSSGAIGLKYLLDASGPKQYFANKHVLDRWPSFVYIDDGEKKRAAKWIDYAPGWYWTTHTTADAANQIILRRSHLRGT